MSGNTWIMIGMIAAAVAAFAIPYGFNKKSKEISTAAIQVNRDYVAGVKVSGGGDYIAGNKVTNIGPNREELEKIIKHAVRESASELSEKFGKNYTIFGISDIGFVVPKGSVSTGLTVNWETGRVLNITGQSVEARLPDIIANTEHIKNFRMKAATVTLQKKVGAHLNLIKTPDFSIGVEVIGIDRNIIVVGLGLASTR